MIDHLKEDFVTVWKNLNTLVVKYPGVMDEVIQALTLMSKLSNSLSSILPVIQKQIHIADTQKSSSEEYALGWKQAIEPFRPLIADSTKTDQQTDEAIRQAAVAISQSFFVSVSGDSDPYRYHLRLSYPNLEALQLAEDKIKRMVRTVLEPSDKKEL